MEELYTKQRCKKNLLSDVCCLELRILDFSSTFSVKMIFFLYEQDVYFETFIDVDNF